MPIVHRWVAGMPDVHLGIGATVGSVIPTVGAVIPAAVGVDIGCGMMAVQTTLNARDLPDELAPMRAAIERAVPHGRGKNGGKGDKGAWNGIPNRVANVWGELEPGFRRIVAKHPKLDNCNMSCISARSAAAITSSRSVSTRPTLSGSCCTAAHVAWATGRQLLHRAGEERHAAAHPQPAGRRPRLFLGREPALRHYVEAVSWAQTFARTTANDDARAARLGPAPQGDPSVSDREGSGECHHNYVAREHHYDRDVFVTRKARCAPAWVSSDHSR